MIEGWRHVVAVAGALGSGLMAGFFLAFSTITMSGLRAVAPAEGLRVMQAINRSPNSSPALLVTLLGTGVVSVAAAAMSVGRLDEASSGYLVSGAALYLVGTLGLTIVFHVPRNLAIEPGTLVLEAADRVIPRSPASSSGFAGQPRAAIAAS